MSKRDQVVGLLEDDPDMAALVSLWLEEAGYAVRWFRNAHEFRRRQGAESVDLLLLDWMLPDATGPEVIRAIRSSANASLPVVFLTARDSEDDIVDGLDCAADDYVVKPPRQRELLARIAAVLRRHAPDGGTDDLLEVPPYRLDGVRRRISLHGNEVELTQREFDLANFLFRRHGRIVSRDALLQNVWNLSAAVSTRTVDTHVSRLRKKLDLGGANGWRLTAVYQHGYRLEQV
ncbi:response regulator transcription factor [Dokdonella sp.]|uniref:response regulator transcription factor n=1 Tax=Dokdonella sp. TaxID=2291710 RepID=UPI0031BFD0C8|nr:response regulator transcription factor [Dokdonella sp.]